MTAGPTEPGQAPEPKVFITYRREETAAHAGRLYDAMVARFGEGNVFMDVDMKLGIDFVERITEAVAACQVLIVVMGPRWATVENEQGTARLADPADFVRLEIETALRRPDVTPIPVLVSGARMPKREDLPPEIQAITRRNALELSDQRWRYDIGRLISRLDELLADIALVPGPPSPERRVAGGKAAPADAAQAPAQAAPPATAAAVEPVETKPAAPLTGVGRWLRWPLAAAIVIAAMAIAAIVVATVAFLDGGRDLSRFVLSPTEAPGDLNYVAEESGAVDPEDERLPRDTQAAFVNVFAAKGVSAKPYWYSESIALDFESETAAQAALAELKAHFQDSQAQEAENVDEIPAKGLGDEAFGFSYTGVQRPRQDKFSGSWEGSSYLYLWRTGTLLQVFELDLSGTVNEDTARSFAETMASRSGDGSMPVTSTPASAASDDGRRRLESLVPGGLSCEESDEPVAGAATLLCAAGSGLAVEYAQFETRDELDDWYAAKVPADLVPGGGSCDERPFRGEKPYVVDGQQVGRFVCFFDNQGEAQLVWTDERWTVGGEAAVYESEGTPGAAPGEEGAQLLFRAWSGRMQLRG